MCIRDRDVGDVRIGVAGSDPTGTIAQPLEVYRRVGYGPDSRYVAALCQRMDCESVLLGLPLNMRAEPSLSAQVLRQYPTGTWMTVLEDMGEWSKVRVNGLEGYVMSKYLSDTSSDSTLYAVSYTHLFRNPAHRRPFQRRVNDSQRRFSQPVQRLPAIQRLGQIAGVAYGFIAAALAGHVPYQTGYAIERLKRQTWPGQRGTARHG